MGLFSRERFALRHSCGRGTHLSRAVGAQGVFSDAECSDGIIVLIPSLLIAFSPRSLDSKLIIGLGGLGCVLDAR